jgi:HEAT repeat protein
MAGKALTDLGHAMQRLERRASSIQGLPPQNNGAFRNPAAKELRAELLQPPGPQAPPAAPLLAQADARPAMNPLRKGLNAALPELARVLVEEPNAQVRLAAAEALEMFGPGVAPVAEVLVTALQDRDRFVRWVAARTLGNANQRNAPGAVAGLARLLQDEDLDVRLAAAESLGDFAEAAAPAVPALIVLVNQDDARMRERAIQSLVEIGPKAAGAVPSLTQALRNKDHRVRRAAAEALGTFQEQARSAVPALLRAIDDPDPEVRKAASDALLSIE